MPQAHRPENIPHVHTTSRFVRSQAPLIIAALIVTGVYTHLIRNVQRVVGTDDFHFAKNIKPFDTVWEWVAHRYDTWSGRIFPEVWLYFYTTAPLNAWRLTTLLLIAVFVVTLVAYARLLRSEQSVIADAGATLLAGALLFLIEEPVLRGGFTWVTGSMNYFWLVPFAIVAFYPFAHYGVRGRLPRAWVCVIAVPAALVAASSSEQLGAVLMVLTTVVTAERWFAARHAQSSPRPLIYLASVSLVSVLAFLVLMLAPGNAKRPVHDAENWLPDFYTTPGGERLGYTVRFVVDGLVNHTGLALPLIWALVLVLVMRAKSWDGYTIAAAGTALVGLSLTLVRPLESGAVFFNLHAVWKGVPMEPVPVLTLLLWIVLLLATALAPLVALRSRLGGAITLLVLGGYASLGAIGLSPSMYASGPRVVFVPTIILLLTGFALFWRVFPGSSRLRAVSLSFVLLLAAAQYAHFVTTLPWISGPLRRVTARIALEPR
ncbi:MAG: hypothetical protein K0Q52_509 [Microbacterium sp.]|jgi:hypothetical protein|nr:hypothetical protein [Microbacterium sp.]